MKNSEVLFKSSSHLWESYIKHPFLKELGEGKLSKERFSFYLLQDYLYLFEYAKVYALGFVKADDMKLQEMFLIGQNVIFEELEIHKKYMLDMGISKDKIENLKPSIYNKAYTNYMLSVAFNGDVDEVIATILPCAWSYSYISKRLKKEYKTHGFYTHWIDSYSSDEFFNSWQWMINCIDEHSYTKEKLCKLKDIFKASSEFEYMFWDMAYNQKLEIV